MPIQQREGFRSPFAMEPGFISAFQLSKRQQKVAAMRLNLKHWVAKKRRGSGEGESPEPETEVENQYTDERESCLSEHQEEIGAYAEESQKASGSVLVSPVPSPG